MQLSSLRVVSSLSFPPLIVMKDTAQETTCVYYRPATAIADFVLIECLIYLMLYFVTFIEYLFVSLCKYIDIQ